MEEKKTYSVVGRVEIGTDEYRDLIEEKAEAQRQYESYRDRAWAAERERDKYKERVGELETALDSYKRFVKDRELTEKYKLFIVGQEDDE